MAKLEYHLFPHLADNYGVLIHAPDTGETACIDCGDTQSYLNALADKDWKLSEIWVTHHHWDHTDGVVELKEKTGAKVIGPREQSKPIAGLDVLLSEGDEYQFVGQKVELLHTPGHTLDMLNFYLPDEKMIFTGDTLFSLGCGRIFEGTQAMMWESLSKLAKLPAETIVYSAHEYTLANARFALTIDPNNKALVERTDEIKKLRAANLPTVPSTIGLELATNPFLRAGDAEIRKQLDMVDATDTEVFAEIRTRKDRF